MSNEAAERLRGHFERSDHLCDYCRVVARVDIPAALANERSAGAAPLDVERLAQALGEYDAWVGFRNDEGHATTARDRYAWVERYCTRLAEGTDR